jgi:hypothetical protein
MGGSLSQWLTGSRGCHLVSNRGSFRKDVLSHHDPGSGPTQPKETMTRFYNQQHGFYAGIDLHASTMHVCVLDAAGTVLLDGKLPCHFETLLRAIAPVRDGLAIGVECMFSWYWLPDRSAELEGRLKYPLSSRPRQRLSGPPCAPGPEQARYWPCRSCGRARPGRVPLRRTSSRPP